MVSQIGTPDRDSKVYQQAVRAFHEAFDAATQKMRRQLRGLEPVDDISTRASLSWPLPEPGGHEFEISIYLGKKGGR